MSNLLDWGKLVSQGRAKAHGISWSNEEGSALFTIARATGKNIAEVAPYIRKGILTLGAFEKAQGSSEIVNPLLKLSKDDLLKKAEAAGISASSDATKEVLAQVISETGEVKEEVKEKVEEAKPEVKKKVSKVVKKKTSKK